MCTLNGASPCALVLGTAVLGAGLAPACPAAGLGMALSAHEAPAGRVIVLAQGTEVPWEMVKEYLDHRKRLLFAPPEAEKRAARQTMEVRGLPPPPEVEAELPPPAMSSLPEPPAPTPQQELERQKAQSIRDYDRDVNRDFYRDLGEIRDIIEAR